MNYRHIFHAGNFADVVKHTVLALILERLGQKPAPFFVLDSHAGLGRYDLTSDQARRTAEADGGIGRVLAALAAAAPPAPPALAPYLGALGHPGGLAAAAPPPGGLRWYPGSPRLARALMRPGDRLVLAELHPEDSATLRREFAGDDQVAVHHRDGWAALKAFLPPAERRGLVLIDPPYESADEAAQLAAGLAAAYRRWPTGIYALWYPIKERPWVWRLHEALATTGITRQMVAELTIYPEDDGRRLCGCGMVVVNPPWHLETALNEALGWLHGVLGQGSGQDAGGVRVDWLVPEAPNRNGS